MNEKDDGWCEICALTPGMVRSMEGGCYKMKAGKECRKLYEVRPVHLLDAEAGGGHGGGLLEESSVSGVARVGEVGVKPKSRHKLFLFPDTGE